MKLKALGVALMLCACGIILSAQEETPPLESEPTVGYMPLIQSPPTCPCLTAGLLPAKAKRELTLSVDIPISPFWDTVKEDRIQNRTVQFGGTATPLRDTVMFGGWPVPRINFTSVNFRIVAEGGIMKTLNANPSRTMKQVRGELEGSVWHILVGTDGFWGQEQIPSTVKGVNFNADFRRHSYGGQGWLGVKFGDFNRSFVAGRYGRGYIKTKGETRFVVPSIVDELDWFPAYFEEFRTVSVSVEGKIKVKRVSQSVRVDDVKYERVALSPDSLRFGENHLQDLWLRTETEVILFSRVSFLRGVVVFTKDFRGQNRLMFTNDYSSVRVLLRLTLN